MLHCSRYQPATSKTLRPIKTVSYRNLRPAIRSGCLERHRIGRGDCAYGLVVSQYRSFTLDPFFIGGGFTLPHVAWFQVAACSPS